MDSSNSGAMPITEVRHGFYPFGFWDELLAQFSLAWPTSLSMLFHYLILPISLAFCGHVGKLELASAAMAISVIYVVMVSVGRGLAFGGDTFFSQTYGSGNSKNVGIYLQKGLIFGFLWALPTVGLLLNTESILLLMGQDSEVAALAQQYTQLFCPGVLAYCWLFMIMRYLLCQNRVIPNLVVCMVSCALNAALNYALIYQAEMGIKGSAVALMLTYYLVLIQLVAYIWGSGIYRETWPGWSWQCLEGWGEFFRVTTYSVSMTLVLWVCTEVGTFLGGLISQKQLAAFSLSFQVEGFAWMVPLGIGGACSTRIGQYLGANEPLGAKTAARVALTTAIVISLVLAGSTFLLRNYIPMLFTDNKDLIEYTAGILRVTAIFVILEGFGGVAVGIVRGVGRQALGTLVMVVSYFVFAWPVGIPLMFATGLGLYGLWWGFVLGAAVQDVSFAAFVATLSWEREAENAQVRAGVGDTFRQPLTVTINDASETTGLLSAQNGHHTSGSYSTQLPSTLGATSLSSRDRTRLLIRRLPVILVYFALFLAGLLCNLFVKVNPKWSSLCIPNNGSNVIDATEYYVSNSSLPFCSDTQSYSSILDNV